MTELEVFSWQAQRYTALANVALEAAQAPDFDLVARHAYLRDMRDDLRRRTDEATPETAYDLEFRLLRRSLNHANEAFSFLDKIVNSSLKLRSPQEMLVQAVQSQITQRQYNAFEDRLSGSYQLEDIMAFDASLLLAVGVIDEPGGFNHAIEAFGAEAVLATVSLG